MRIMHICSLLEEIVVAVWEEGRGRVAALPYSYTYT
jgi:hypothetical protein